MNYLRERGITYPVHVFSDDIIEAKKMLSQLLGEHVTWVEPPLESYPAESLLLMSKAKVNIIANSTYSWWAGALNTNNNLVLAPKSWFKNMLTPEYIYPPEWIQIESHWEE
jgi:hypothetical protein